MKKLYFLTLSFFIIYKQTALAEFQKTNPKSQADLPVANSLNTIFHYTNIGLALAFLLSLILLISSGVNFLTAGGDEGGLDTAHSMWKLAVLGLSSALIGYIIINLIKYFI